MRFLFVLSFLLIPISCAGNDCVVLSCSFQNVAFGGLSNTLGYIFQLINYAFTFDLRPLFPAIIPSDHDIGLQFALLFGIPEDERLMNCESPEISKGPDQYCADSGEKKTELQKLWCTKYQNDPCLCSRVHAIPPEIIRTKFSYNQKLNFILRRRFYEYGVPQLLLNKQKEVEQVVSSLDTDQINIAIHYRLGDTASKAGNTSAHKRGDLVSLLPMVEQLGERFKPQNTRCHIVSDSPEHEEIIKVQNLFQNKICDSVTLTPDSPLVAFFILVAADFSIVQNSGFGRFAMVLRKGPSLVADMRFQNLSSVDEVTLIDQNGTITKDRRDLWPPTKPPNRDLLALLSQNVTPKVTWSPNSRIQKMKQGDSICHPDSFRFFDRYSGLIKMEEKKRKREGEGEEKENEGEGVLKNKKLF